VSERERRSRGLARKLKIVGVSVKRRTSWRLNADAPQLFHQEHRATALNLAGDPPMQMRRHAGNAAGEDLAALSDEFFQQVRILIIDRLDRDVDPAARHRAIGAAESGTAFGSFGLHR
jgi:hypothetical protein